MLTKKLTLLALVLIAGPTAFGAKAVKAQLLAQGLEAPLSCTTSIGTGASLTVQAGETPSGAVPYPRDVPCPGNSGTCSEWNLEVSYVGGNPNHSFTSVSSALDIFSCSPSCSVENPPGAGDSSTKVGEFLHEQRTVRFNSNASVLFARFVTEKSVPRVASVGGRRGSSTGACLIQGAGTPEVVNPEGVVAVSTIFTPNPPESAICPVEVIRDAAGVIVEVRLAPGADSGCEVTHGLLTDIDIDGLQLHYAGSGDGSNKELLILGSTESCTRYVFNGKVTYVDPPPNPPKCAK